MVEEVNNNEELNNTCLVKALVSTLQIELANKSDNIQAQCNTAADFAKSEAEVARLQIKLDDSRSTVKKLRDKLGQSVPSEQLYQALADSKDLKNDLDEAQDDARVSAKELESSRSEVSKLTVKLKTQLSEVIALKKICL